MIDKKNIYLKYNKLSNQEKENIGKIIVNVLSPLIYLKNDIELSKTFENYLFKLNNDNMDDVSYSEEYMRQINKFFNGIEYTESSFNSYEDKNFYVYLSYLSAQALTFALKNNQGCFSNILVTYFIEVSEILDDYIYNNSKDNNILELDKLLNLISERRMQKLCEDLFKKFFDNVGNNGYVTQLEQIIKEFKYELKSIFNINTNIL